ncbi:MAG TPA: STAS domain-containing protein [Candidatus Sulfotelmatobacter sp.]|jgi:hypothetical protein|nr:STAS domain-containing protein [Candidatus Sulfotelmatobacter sp.]
MTDAQIQIKCDGDITFARMDEFREKLQQALDNGLSVEIDSVSIGEVAFGLIQLLIATRSSASRRGVPFSMKQPIGEPMLAALRRGGFLAAEPSSTNSFWLGETVS